MSKSKNSKRLLFKLVLLITVVIMTYLLLDISISQDEIVAYSENMLSSQASSKSEFYVDYQSVMFENSILQSNGNFSNNVSTSNSSSGSVNYSSLSVTGSGKEYDANMDALYDDYIKKSTAANKDGWYFKMFDGPTVDCAKARKVDVFGVPTQVYDKSAENKWPAIEGWPHTNSDYPNKYASVKEGGAMDFNSSKFDRYNQMYAGRYMVALGPGILLENWKNEDYLDGPGGRSGQAHKKYGLACDVVICDKKDSSKEYYIPCVIAEAVGHTYLGKIGNPNAPPGICYTSVKKDANKVHEPDGPNSKAVIEFCTGSKYLGLNNRITGLATCFYVKAVIIYEGEYC